MGTSINYKRVTTRGAIRPFMAVSGGTPLKFLIFRGPLIIKTTKTTTALTAYQAASYQDIVS